MQQEVASLSPAAFTAWLQALGVEAAWRVGVVAGLGGGPRECPETWVCTDRCGCEGGRSSETGGTASEPQRGRDALLCHLFASRDRWDAPRALPEQSPDPQAGGEAGNSQGYEPRSGAKPVPGYLTFTSPNLSFHVYKMG